MICHKCQRSPHEIPGYLKRVNEKGVEGIFECVPMCYSDKPTDASVLAAILGDPECLKPD